MTQSMETYECEEGVVTCSGPGCYTVIFMAKTSMS